MSEFGYELNLVNQVFTESKQVGWDQNVWEVLAKDRALMRDVLSIILGASDVVIKPWFSDFVDLDLKSYDAAPDGFWENARDLSRKSGFYKGNLFTNIVGTDIRLSHERSSHAVSLDVLKSRRTDLTEYLLLAIFSENAFMDLTFFKKVLSCLLHAQSSGQRGVLVRTGSNHFLVRVSISFGVYDLFRVSVKWDEYSKDGGWQCGAEVFQRPEETNAYNGFFPQIGDRIFLGSKRFY